MFDQQVTFLTVSDLNKSAEFYENHLGLPMVLDQGSCRIYQVSPDGFIGICESNDRMNVQTDGVIFTLVTQDVDGHYARLKANGVPFDHPPQENPKYNIYHCFARDPDGHLLEIQRFGDAAWPKAARGF